MSHHRIPAIRLLGTAVLGLSLLAGTAPAQASEVVKLARLLITGKRQPSKPPSAPQPNPTDRGGSTDAPGPQSKLTDPDALLQQTHVATERRGTSESTATMSMVD
ncbi:hypothetical protein SAMN05216359_109187 [Roseateles sp. YR242]|uniref:hypothetical protein n=1 Tax=Roseateles sp. YR242 TaxID=1855305 RepID=UPI0008D4BD9C|nr:hypothetical protein [Roseateles sp. YR242]SEL46820.1 hypothetical protein SAMN05216359_109187 [Roseateles sp. YR242]